MVHIKIEAFDRNRKFSFGQKVDILQFGMLQTSALSIGKKQQLMYIYIF